MTIPASTLTTLQALQRGDLAGARELRLPGLSTFPPEIFGLADTLEILDLSGGSLSALPDDLGRLTKLRVLFASGAPFERLPPCLGDCTALSQVGFRGCGIREVPAEALPPRLRWLTLTDNAIEHLPDELGRRPALQKLMLSGNRLNHLPDCLAGAPSLELIRLAANRFEHMPSWLMTLPRLAWLSWAGNPADPGLPPAQADVVEWRDLELGAFLGEGASGRVYRVRRTAPSHAQPELALKLFKGAMTSDGLPDREMAACLSAGDHPHLAGGLARLAGHPDGVDGLLMPLLPDHWRVLAGPPSLESCTRDVYEPGLRLAPPVALRLARSVASAAAHLHAHGLSHGDLYAHNTLWDGSEGHAVLSDFGAAFALPPGPEGPALQRIEMRALGLLFGEILAHADPLAAELDPLRQLAAGCTQPDPAARPLAAEVVAALQP